MTVNDASSVGPQGGESAPARDIAPVMVASYPPKLRPLGWVAPIAELHAVSLWRQLLAAAAAGILALCALLLPLGFGPDTISVAVQTIVPATIVVGFPVLWISRKRKVTGLGHTGFTVLGGLLTGIALSLISGAPDSFAVLLSTAVMGVALAASFLIRVLIRHPLVCSGIVVTAVVSASFFALIG